MVGEDDLNEEEAKEEDEYRAKMRELIQGAREEAEAEDDAGGFESPLEPATPVDTVGEEEGRDLAYKANNRGPDGKFLKKGDESADAAPAGDDAGKPPSADAGDTAKAQSSKVADASAGQADDDAALATMSQADLLAGFDPKRAAEVTRRMADSDEVLSIFKGQEDVLKAQGFDKPAAAVKRLLYLNEFARKQPDEYIAWAVGEIDKESAGDILGKAAKRLGYTLTKDDDGSEDDDDDYDDDRTRQLKKENAELRRQQQATQQFGPDAPQHTAVQQISNQLSTFIGERDESGAPKRPLWNQLAPMITAQAGDMARKLGRAVTFEELDGIYSGLEQQIRTSIGMPDTSAAQKKDPVPDQKASKAAPQPKAASKMIDGDGQGASRQPALGPDASIRSTLKYYLGKSNG